jgi:hypothetical protein
MTTRMKLRQFAPSLALSPALSILEVGTGSGDPVLKPRVLS